MQDTTLLAVGDDEFFDMDSGRSLDRQVLYFLDKISYTVYIYSPRSWSEVSVVYQHACCLLGLLLVRPAFIFHKVVTSVAALSMRRGLFNNHFVASLSQCVSVSAGILKVFHSVCQ